MGKVKTRVTLEGDKNMVKIGTFGFDINVVV